jgi:CRISPR/Cas system CMR-associated protein Cmr1 (group 7 of RAMP superfamily)
MNWQRDIELLTSTFNRGAYQDTPEIRVPSIRGMVRWWFRALGGSPDEEKEVFGGMKHFGQKLRDDVTASRLVFRVTQANVRRASPDPGALPHKTGGQSNPQAAFAPGGGFQLQVLSRLGPLPAALMDKASRALEVWLLLGSLGLRANRAGGSIWPANGTAPNTPQELRARLDQLGCSWPLYLAGTEVGNAVEVLRAAATDTVEEPRWIFGSARGERQASLLKFKVVRFGQQLRLLITAAKEGTITEAQKALRGHRSKPETWVKIMA